MEDCPLSDVTFPEAEGASSRRTPTGWHFPVAEGIEARIDGFRDGIICRVAPGEDREVMQLGIGHATSALCNALYSPGEDCALVFEGDGLRLETRGDSADFGVRCSGPLTVTVLEKFMRLHRDLPWFQPLDRDRFPRPPAGWCSWYCYGLGITEEQIVENTDWLADNLKPFGCEWVQIDDGWQGRGEGFGSNRDWFTTCEEDFPRGMKWCADYIRSKDLRPGIWCIPFTQSDSELYEHNPDLFVRLPDGSSPGERDEPLEYEWMPEEERCYDWAGRFYIDPTSEESQDYLKKLFEMLCEQWGYEYVKIDAQAAEAPLLSEHRTRLADSSLEGTRAYRKGLEPIRSVMGEDRFLLNCGQGWDSCGLCEGIRIGADVKANWEGLQNAVEPTLRWLYLNTIAFYTDPDVVCVREPLTLDQARVWATLVGITGQLLMASDPMAELPDERVELLRRIFPVADVHPMELYPVEREKLPTIFDLKVHRPEVGRWDVLALFNWYEQHPQTIELCPERLGLEGDEWICLDAWRGEILHAGDGRQCVKLPITSCRVISYWPQTGRPQFVGTSRHLTQGAIDVQRVGWDEDSLRLSGSSRVVGGDPYDIRIFVPQGYTPADPDVAICNGLTELRIERPQNDSVDWEMAFEKE